MIGDGAKKAAEQFAAIAGNSSGTVIARWLALRIKGNP